MLILGIETSTMDAGVALHDGSRVIGEVTLSIGSRHAEALLPSAQHLLAQTGRTIHDVTHVAVDRGPGLFTGLRVGVTTARAVAFACGVPLVAVSSLEVLAGTHGRAGEVVLAVLDARRREVYAGAYRIDDDGSPCQLDEPAVGAAHDLVALPRFADLVAFGSVVVVGDGAATYPEAFASVGPIVSVMRPSARGVVQLAVAAIARNQAILDPFELLYLRAPDAEITWDNRHGPAAGSAK
jgi:tRNA threonylcarbamoyladenosine biosynthesis protein TsaB